MATNACDEFTAVFCNSSCFVQPCAVIKNELRDVQAGALSLGMHISVLEASTSGEIDAAFATFLVDWPWRWPAPLPLEPR
jgi:hypothetical protein